MAVKVIDITRESNGGIVVTVNGVPRSISNPNNIQVKVLYGVNDADGIGAGVLGIVVKATGEGFRIQVLIGDTFTINGAAAPTIPTDQVYVLNNWVFAGDSTYSATPTKLAQTITFGALAAKVHTDPAFTLVATSSSGLAVVFTSSDATKATCGGTNGSTCTPVAAGTPTIHANVAATTFYAAAAQVDQVLTLS